MTNDDFLKSQIDSLNELFEAPVSGDLKENKDMKLDELFKSIIDEPASDSDEIAFGEQILRAEDNQLSDDELLNIEDRVIKDKQARTYIVVPEKVIFTRSRIYNVAAFF